MNHDPFCQYFFLPPTSFSFSTCEGKIFQVQYIIRQRGVANGYSQVLKAELDLTPVQLLKGKLLTPYKSHSLNLENGEYHNYLPSVM